MENLLLLVHRIPYPPNKGDKIRSYNLLKKLAQDYRLFLGAFIDDDADWKQIPGLQSLCCQSCFRPINPTLGKIKTLKGFLTGQPLTVPYYADPQMKKWVEKVIADNQIERVVVYSSAMAQYVNPEWAMHKVIDFVDVDSDKWHQYASGKRWPASWVYRREGDLLLEYDRCVASEFDWSLFVSEQEAGLFKTLVPDSAERVTHYENGVDLDYFDPKVVTDNPYENDEQAIVFTGAMDYWANVDAVDWFAREVFPSVREKVPAASFYIVGARPSDKVKKLTNINGVKVSGAVKDIRPYIKQAALAVAPMRIARGIQNKVLEAMALDRPVVATTPAIEGIKGWQQCNVIVEDNAALMADKIIARLNGDSHGVTGSNRDCIVRHYSWDTNLERIEALLESGLIPKRVSAEFAAKQG